VVIIDFNHAIIYPIIHWPHPKRRKDSDGLPTSPIESYWPFAPGGSSLGSVESEDPWVDWVPESWLKNQELAAEWLLETWGSASSHKYSPLSDYFLARFISPAPFEEMLEDMGNLLEGARQGG
jgi:hypothetical protein